MRIELLRKTRIAENNRCAQLNLFTTRHSIDEIQALGRKIVCFGADNSSWFYITALREAGIGPDVITDNNLNGLNSYLDDIPVLQPTVLLKEKEKYYFIVTLAKTQFINEVRRQLLLWGCEDFAILTHDFVLDLDRVGHRGMKSAFLVAFNKIYKNVDFSKNHFDEARYNFINPIKWWYNAAEWILAHYDGRKHLSLLDVGPGCGLASLIYKKLLDVSVNWINLDRPKANHMVSLQQNLLEDEKIGVQYGYIETDDFRGTYDIIIFTDVVEHLAHNPVNTLKKLYAMLNPQGHLVVTTPAQRAGIKYYASWKDMPFPQKGKDSGNVMAITGMDHVYEYTVEELNDILTQSGFHIAYCNIDSKISIICTK